MYKFYQKIPALFVDYHLYVFLKSFCIHSFLEIKKQSPEGNASQRLFLRRKKAYFASDPMGSQGASRMTGVSSAALCRSVKYFLLTTTWYMYSSNQASDMT